MSVTPSHSRQVPVGPVPLHTGSGSRCPGRVTPRLVRARPGRVMPESLRSAVSEPRHDRAIRTREVAE